MKKILIALFLSLFIVSACGYAQRDIDGNIIMPDFYDGTWSSCTYIDKHGGRTTPPPVQLGGAPMERTEPDGSGIKCIPMQKGE